MAARSEFIDRVSGLANALHRSISGGEELRVGYRPNVAQEGGKSAQAVLFEALANSAGEDMRRGFTTAGPHRDDIAIQLNGMDLRTYGSQGQQRTAALSLKLSELALMREETGETPVLLLDDVLSELDDFRQQMLLQATGDCQVFLTCTSLAGLERAGFNEIQVYSCKNGGLTAI